jgi:hypothetical protein
VSLVEVVETRLTTAEVAASPAPTDFSSSESLRMMTVSSLGDPRRSQLSSP